MTFNRDQQSLREWKVLPTQPALFSLGILWKVIEKMVGGPGSAVIGGALGAASAVPAPWGISFGVVVGAGCALLLTLLVLAIID